MKARTRTGLTLAAGLTLATVLSATASEVVYLDRAHMDLRVQYDPAAEETNRLGLVLGYDTGSMRLTATNDAVYIVGGNEAKLAVPANPDYAFLGPAGAPVWVLPQSQNLALPYLGISAEDIPAEVFDGPLSVELVSVEGPGDFFAWSNSGAGQPPDLKLACTDGVVWSGHRAFHPLAGSHEHCNWAFTTNGLYRITLRVTGQRVGEAVPIIGKEVAWAFQILPLRPWETWVSTQWPPATAPAVAGPGADPDEDGLVNLLEYAFGNDPHQLLLTNTPAVLLVAHDGASRGALRYVHALQATDVDLAVLAFSQVPGLPQSLGPASDVIPHGETEVVTVYDPVPEVETAQRFYQLQATLHYP